MTKRKTRKPSWLLTVASAYSVLSGCSDDPTSKPHASMGSHDGGHAASSPPGSDAATAKDSGHEAATAEDSGHEAATAEDSGHEAGGDDVADPGDEIDFTTLIGVIIFPPGSPNLPELDAGSTDTPPAEDASTDADVTDADAWIGLVALPPAATGDEQGLAMARLDRPPPKAPGA